MNVKVYRREFQRMNCLIAEVGSNCPRGGDAGHGGRTVLRFRDAGGTVFSARVDAASGGMRAFDEVSEVELVFKGDGEHDTVVEALKFMLAVLEATAEAQSSNESVD